MVIGDQSYCHIDMSAPLPAGIRVSVYCKPGGHESATCGGIP
jgi:hypothetical protein